MFHAHTARVLDEWTRRRGVGRRLPARTELSPMLFGALLPQMFILADDGASGWRFRVAGGLVTDLCGRALKGERFLELWAFADRGAVAAAVEAARRSADPCVLGCEGSTAAGRPLAVELTLAPVTGPLEEADRVLGLLQPLSATARLMGEPLGPLRLLEARDADTPPPRAGRVRLVVDNTHAPPLG